MLAIPVFSFSQEGFPVFSEENVWEIKYSDSWTSPSYGTIHIRGDTVIDNENYKILSEKSGDIILGFFYDQGKQSYFRYNDTVEVLIYDFNLEAGDTFNLVFPLSFTPDWPEFESMIVQEVDSVEFNDGSYRKRIVFETENSYSLCAEENLMWIEGVGSNVHPFYPLYDCFEYGIQLDCYINNGNELYGKCQYLSVDKYSIVAVKAFPNPFFDQINILDNEHVIVSTALLDINGNQVANANKSELLNLEYLPSGVYMLKVWFKDGSISLSRLMKY